MTRIKGVNWGRTSPVGATCPECLTIHGADATVAVDRFSPNGVTGYRSRLGGPVRADRETAGRDYCETI